MIKKIIIGATAIASLIGSSIAKDIDSLRSHIGSTFGGCEVISSDSLFLNNDSTKCYHSDISVKKGISDIRKLVHPNFLEESWIHTKYGWDEIGKSSVAYNTKLKGYSHYGTISISNPELHDKLIELYKDSPEFKLYHFHPASVENKIEKNIKSMSLEEVSEALETEVSYEKNSEGQDLLGCVSFFKAYELIREVCQDTNRPSKYNCNLESAAPSEIDLQSIIGETLFVKKYNSSAEVSGYIISEHGLTEYYLKEEGIKFYEGNELRFKEKNPELKKCEVSKIKRTPIHEAFGISTDHFEIFFANWNYYDKQIKNTLE